MKTLNLHRVATLAVFAILIGAALTANPATARAASTSNGQGPAITLAQYSCSYVAHFVADITVPDNSMFAPGTPFTKIWRIRNDGTCTWGSGGYALHTLTFVGGTRLANSGGVPLPPRVGPGEEIDISIPMVAAIYDGRYISQWKLQFDNGSLIGFGPSGQAPLYVQIVVSRLVPPPTPGGGDMPPSGICSYYTVRPGDYLKLIASRFGTTWEAIAQANRLYSPNMIYAGMRLAIPCGNATPPPEGGPQSYTSALYHYAVKAPAGWTVKVNTSVPPGTGTNPEYVTFSAPGTSLPEIDIDVLTGTPPFTGFENCRNLIFRGLPACSLSLPAGQNPASRLLIFQRGSAYFHIAMVYESADALASWDTFLSSFSFAD